jgi:hypothetical protein
MAIEQTNVPSISVAMESRAFSIGFAAGLTGYQDGNQCHDIQGAPTEAGIVDIIRNLCEISREGRLTEELLCSDCGLIAGWLSRPVEQG